MTDTAIGHFYVIELRDSDGNDCTVADLLIGPVASTDAALDKAMEYVKATWPNDEFDGDYGTYHPCDCECEHGVSPGDDDHPAHIRSAKRNHGESDCRRSWDCSHGGILIDDHNVEEYANIKDAREHLRRYHTTVDLTD